MRIVVLALLVLSMVSFAAAEPGLLLYCPFDGTLECADGELPTTAVGLSYDEGVFGQGVVVSFGDALDYSTAGNIVGSQGTVALWVIPYDDSADNQKAYIFDVFDRYGGTNSFSRLDMRYDGSGADKLGYGLNPHSDGGPNSIVIPATLGWDANEPHFLTMVWNEQSHLTAYMDGVLVDSRTDGFPRVLQGLSQFINLGYYKDTNAHHFNGVLDDLRIYDRELSAEEVSDLYSAATDADGDGVSDEDDYCPDTTGEALSRGCSCEQILDLKPGENNGELKNGCSEETVENFENGTGWAKDLV